MNTGFAIDFAGGLGDFIRQCYTSNSYTFAARAQSVVDVLLGSHNPFIFEAFTHHPNRRNFRLHLLNHKYDELFNAGLRGHEIIKRLYEFADVDISNRILASSTEKPRFHALDEKKPLTTYVVVQPYASSAGKSAPTSLVTEILNLLQYTEAEIHVVVRNYARASKYGNLIHCTEQCIDTWKLPNVVIHENLSVPASINLVASAALVISTHSALLQCAWYEGLATCALYPTGYTDWMPDKIGRDYTWRALDPNCHHRSFDNFDSGSFSEFLKLQVPQLRFQGPLDSHQHVRKEYS